MDQDSPLINFLKVAAGLHAKEGDNTQLAGDVIPIRPPGSPANTSGREGQRRNEGRQNPNTDGTNITRIYG